MAHADYIIALDGDGKIRRQGNCEFIINQPVSQFDTDTIGNATLDAASEATIKSLPSYEPVLAEPSALKDSVDTATQRLGDRSVYKYYFATFGWFQTTIFFALQTILVFCIKFPGKPIDLQTHSAFSVLTFICRNHSFLVGRV